MPPRFYCESLSENLLPDAICALGPEESRHARRVLRLSEGDLVELFDGRGQLAEAEVQPAAGNTVLCRVVAHRSVTPRGPRLTVAAAVPKGSRGEDMVNQLGQLGVDVFTPLRCARSVVEPSATKLERYEKAAMASAKQSGRPTLMRVEPLTGFNDVIGKASSDARQTLILDPRGEPLPAQTGDWAQVEQITVLIGPEGGWTEDELVHADQAGVVRWRIAEHVLRIETAATAAAAVVGYFIANQNHPAPRPDSGV